MIKFAKGCCGEEELKEVGEAFDYGYFGHAYKVNEFEQELKKYLETNYEVVATNTGTTALHLALDSIGVSEGDEVIIPSFTFVATAQAVTACGAIPVFCDIDEETFLMDISDVKSKITDRTKAIIPVHYAGNPCDMSELLAIKDKYGIRIIEDAAHAIGSEYNGKKVGSFGDIICFSFDSIKVMTCGEGGAVVTSDVEVAELCRKKRLLGIDRKNMHLADWKERSWSYDVSTQGYRYHMSNINAAIGLAQIKKIDKFITHRRDLCKQYDNLLSSIDHIKTMNLEYDLIGPFMYVIKVKDGLRNEMKDFLQTKDIETGVSYSPCHLFGFYYDSDVKLRVTEKISEEILCLPLHYDLTEENVTYIVNNINAFLSERKSFIGA